MRDLSHKDATELPPPMPCLLNELAWARRERADANIRRAIGELRALAVEDVLFTEQYRAMADAFESALELINTIEDLQNPPPGQFSMKVVD